MKSYKELLEEVIKFAHGEEKYNFRHLAGQEYANASFDAWMKLEVEIINALQNDTKAGS